MMVHGITSSPAPLIEQYNELISLHPTAETRTGQRQMVEAIDGAIRKGRHLIVEAGTGLGKSFGYLIPALLSGVKPIVVSTGTIALQEQLIDKDLPWLMAGLGLDLQVKLVKGRGNYLCIHKLDELAKELGGKDKAIQLHLGALRSALADGWDGDLANLDITIPKELWEEIKSTHDECLSWRCQYWDANPYRQSREALEKADLLITNHALYCQDLVTSGGILPPHEVLILDEAHSFRQYATGALTSRIGKYTSTRLLNRLRKRLAPAPDHLVWTLKDGEASLLSWLFEQSGGRTTFRLKPDAEFLEIASRVEGALADLSDWVRTLSAETGLPEAETPLDEVRQKAYRQQAQEQVDTLRQDWLWFLQDQVEERKAARVNWAEVDNRSLYFELKSTPLDVSDRLAEVLWPEKTAILTSATLSVNRSLSFHREALGLPQRQTDVLVLPSPFNYQEQCQLYLPAPQRFPADPNDTLAYAEAVAREVVGLLEKTHGRAFVLFTSYDNLNRVAQLVVPQTVYPVRLQGDLPRNRLLDWFRKTPGSVLFGTATFWEGIDIPGEALSCVVIDKIPFTSPEDPVHQAQVERIKAEGGDWFKDYALPLAVLRLKQGVGRLIRTQSDHGVLAILDPRIQTKGYGRTILASLPPMAVVRNLSEVRV